LYGELDLVSANKSNYLGAAHNLVTRHLESLRTVVANCQK
jgi:hypothetical protein